jgi:hypothetical protein
VFGVGSRDVFAVGDSGVVLQYEGRAWVRMETPVSQRRRRGWRGDPVRWAALVSPDHRDRERTPSRHGDWTHRRLRRRPSRSRTPLQWGYLAAGPHDLDGVSGGPEQGRCRELGGSRDQSNVSGLGPPLTL